MQVIHKIIATFSIALPLGFAAAGDPVNPLAPVIGSDQSMQLWNRPAPVNRPAAARTALGYPATAPPRHSGTSLGRPLPKRVQRVREPATPKPSATFVPAAVRLSIALNGPAPPEDETPSPSDRLPDSVLTQDSTSQPQEVAPSQPAENEQPSADTSPAIDPLEPPPLIEMPAIQLQPAENADAPQQPLPDPPAASSPDVDEVPSIIHTQRLPKVQKSQPQRLPYIIGESQGSGPSLYDAFRLPNLDNQPHEPLQVAPLPPRSDPRLDSEITGIAIPDVPPMRRETIDPPRPDAVAEDLPRPAATPSQPLPQFEALLESITETPAADPQPAAPIETLAPPRKTSPQPDESSVVVDRVDPQPSLQRDGKWWDDEVRKPLLRFDRSQAMTLEDAYRAALRFSPELLSLTAEVDSRGYEVARLDAGFDWTVFVESIWAHEDDPVGDALAGAAGRLEANDYGTRFGGRQRNRLGGDLEIAHRTGFRDSNSSFFTPPDQANQRLSIDYTQPLLRGAGYQVNTSPVELSKFAHQVSVEDLQAGIEQQLQVVAVAYWNLVGVRGRFVQTRASWHRADKLLKIVEKRQQIDAGKDNMNRIRSAVASRYAATVSAEYDVVRAQEALLREIFGSNYAQQQGFEFVTTTLPPETGEASDVQHDVEVGLAYRPEVRRALKQIQSAAIENNVADNELLPVLNLVLSTYSASLRGNKQFGDAFRDQFVDSNPGISGGLTFEVPVYNRAANARQRQTIANLKRFEADLQGVAADIALEVRDRWLATAQAATDLDLKGRALVSAHEDLNYVNARMRYLADGTSFTDLYLDNILRAQDRLQASENSLLQSQINYGVAQIDLGRATGTLRQSLMGPPNVASFAEPQLVH
ncbi:TolC family protein [Rosistilla oblonga]|uniref:TolC family protein n=1 Tax=Rosistilla oblonga TaxID=2527990 RepID=UPI003A977034